MFLLRDETLEVVTDTTKVPEDGVTLIALVPVNEQGDG